MSSATLFSALGVSLILLAFIGSSFNKISQTSLAYWLLNLAGGILSTIGAALMASVPFVVLEAVWTVASVIGLAKHLKTDQVKKG
ncbi:MAG: hypothetical protein IPM82_23675 [Saprospiraceae bacterium]|nr:hypothetical protein [Saprospiraceae bacterium]